MTLRRFGTRVLQVAGQVLWELKRVEEDLKRIASRCMGTSLNEKNESLPEDGVEDW